METQMKLVDNVDNVRWIKQNLLEDMMNYDVTSGHHLQTHI